jgi:hypothetical protein
MSGDDAIGPIDVNVDEVTAVEMARMLVTRACENAPMAWAEIHWDGARYPHSGDLVLHLTGLVEQLLNEIGQVDGRTSRDVWRHMLLGGAQ